MSEQKRCLTGKKQPSGTGNGLSPRVLAKATNSRRSGDSYGQNSNLNMVFDSCVQGLKAPLFIHLYVLYITELRAKGSSCACCSSGWKEGGKTGPTGKLIF